MNTSTHVDLQAMPVYDSEEDMGLARAELTFTLKVDEPTHWPIVYRLLSIVMESYPAQAHTQIPRTSIHPTMIDHEGVNSYRENAPYSRWVIINSIMDHPSMMGRIFDGIRLTLDSLSKLDAPPNFDPNLDPMEQAIKMYKIPVGVEERQAHYEKLYAQEHELYVRSSRASSPA